MANEVSAADGAIERGAQIVAQAKIQLNTDITQLEGKLAGIGASWQGSAATAFTSLMQAWRAQAKKITDNLDAFEANLKSSQVGYTTSDDTSASAMSNLQSRLG
ncbi:hypothetical protein GCM10027064_08380 [Microbacterium petrolearium]|jgi:WXG100 family type VII secretion target